MNKARFLGTFLVVFALLLIVWSWTGAARWYTDGLLITAGAVGPMVHGWVLEIDPHGQRAPFWVYGENRVKAAIQFDALAVGLVPALALLAATPGIRLRRRAALMALGAALCFAIATSVVVLFPLLVFYKNAFTDVIGTFIGLVAFVGAPVIVWFVLAFRQLAPLLPSFQRPAPPAPRRR